MLHKRFQAILMDLLRQKLNKDTFYSLECYLFKTYNQGFYVYAKPNPSNDPEKVVDYVVRYTGALLWLNLVSFTMMGNRLLSGISAMKIIKRLLRPSLLSTLLNVLSFISMMNSLKLFVITDFMLKSISIIQNFLRCSLLLNLKLNRYLKTGITAFYFLLVMILLNVPVATPLNSSISFILTKRALIIRLNFCNL